MFHVSSQKGTRHCFISVDNFCKQLRNITQNLTFDMFIIISTLKRMKEIGINPIHPGLFPEDIAERSLVGPWAFGDVPMPTDAGWEPSNADRLRQLHRNDFASIEGKLEVGEEGVCLIVPGEQSQDVTVTLHRQMPLAHLRGLSVAAQVWMSENGNEITDNITAADISKITGVEQPILPGDEPREGAARGRVLGVDQYQETMTLRLGATPDGDVSSVEICGPSGVISQAGTRGMFGERGVEKNDLILARVAPDTEDHQPPHDYRLQGDNAITFIHRPHGGPDAGTQEEWK
jgi:hypothetical protein